MRACFSSFPASSLCGLCFRSPWTDQDGSATDSRSWPRRRDLSGILGTTWSTGLFWFGSSLPLSSHRTNDVFSYTEGSLPFFSEEKKRIFFCTRQFNFNFQPSHILHKLNKSYNLFDPKPLVFILKVVRHGL